MIIDKNIFGGLSLIAALISYVFYFSSIAKGNTKPHIFSWLTWGILTAIAFFAQYKNHAGAGAWATCSISFFCFLVAFIALWKGEKEIKLSDIITFTSALMIIPIWYYTNNDLNAVILIIFIDMLGGYYPTFRKSYKKPNEENLTTYFIGILQIMLSLIAIENYILVNILYPVFVMIANLAFVIMVLWRRKNNL
ncbi:MAG: hypothetical protein WCJ33_10210 [Pseudomonadota bacterium]